jgi:predicted transposase YbfD/YdcC
VHIASAFLCCSGLTFGEVRTAEKSNEKTAIPELLKLLSIEGSIVSIDAGGTYTDIAQQIIKENKADYVLALKGNQASMHRDAALFFTGVDLGKDADAEAKMSGAAARMPSLVAAAGIPGALGQDAPAFLGCEFDSTQTLEKGHGRAERRLYAICGDISWISRYGDWEGLASIGMAVSITTNIKTGATSSDTRFFISSISDIGEFAQSVRSHWQIESCHWTLDVSFGEDKSRARKDNEPQNLAMLRKLALNYLRVQKNIDLADESAPGKVKRESFKVKRKRAMMRDDYLEKVMIGNFR